MAYDRGGGRTGLIDTSKSLAEQAKKKKTEAINFGVPSPIYRPTNTTTPDRTAPLTYTGSGTGSATVDPATGEITITNTPDTVMGTGSWIGGNTQDSTDSTTTDLLNAQQRAQKAALDKALSNSMGNIDSQYAGIDKNAYAARNTAAGESDVAAMNFAQRAASRGITGSAASIPEIYRNSALQGRIGQIDSGAMESRNLLDSQRTQLQNNYNFDLASVKANAQATALQSYIDKLNAEQETQRSDFINTTGAYSNDYQAQINKITGDNLKSNDWQIPYLEQARRQKIEEQRQAELEAQQAAAKLQMSSGGTSGTPAMDSNTAYATDYMTVQSGNTSPAAIMANQAALMSQYGEAKYKSLLKLAYKYFRSSTTTGR